MPGTQSAYAERVADGYFLDFVLKREKLARYGLSIDDANMMVMTTVGNDNQNITMKDKERYNINVHYARDYQKDLSALERVLLPLPNEHEQIPIQEITDVKLVQDPSMIRDENDLLADYVYVDFDTNKVDINHYIDQTKRTMTTSIRIEPKYSIS